MLLEISCRGEGLGIRPLGLMLIHISAQNRFAQSTGAAVHEDNQLLFAKAESLERRRIQNLLNALQLREVVAPTNGAERFIEFSGFQFSGSEHFAHIALPRMLEVETLVGPAIQLDIALDQVGLEQRHAAADIPSDKVR